jgi:hypothetical protein
MSFLKAQSSEMLLRYISYCPADLELKVIRCDNCFTCVTLYLVNIEEPCISGCCQAGCQRS